MTIVTQCMHKNGANLQCCIPLQLHVCPGNNINMKGKHLICGTTGVYTGRLEYTYSKHHHDLAITITIVRIAHI